MDSTDMKAHTEAMLALASAINNLVQALPPRNALGGGYSSPMFTVECRCTCGSRPNYPGYYQGQ